MQTRFRQPEYLSGDDQPVLRVRCPVHGFIRFSENERKIIDHHLFRRLRWIRQLALTELVYPGAVHSRFEHSLGVMEVATRIFDSLAQTHGTLMEESFKTVEQLKDAPLAKARQLVRLAALLHDTGHCCFSHAAEEVIHKDSDHEGLTVHVLTQDNLFGGLLNRQYFDQCSKLTSWLIKPEAGKFPPQLQVLRDIISGQIDADRTDYLLRDSLHCGVDYGLFDYRRMIECLTLNPNEYGGLEIALHRDGIHTFEALILARYQMNTQVYYHRLRRIYDLYLQEYFKTKGIKEFDTNDKILKHNDMTMMTEIMNDTEDTSHPGHIWAMRIRNRTHHRMVYESDEDTGVVELKKTKAAFDKIKIEYPEVDFRLDEAEVGIHKLLLPDDMDQAGYVQFHVIDSDGSSELLSRRSAILKKIPRRFRVVRIFADLDREQIELKRTIAAKCKEFTKG